MQPPGGVQCSMTAKPWAAPHDSAFEPPKSAILSLVVAAAIVAVLSLLILRSIKYANAAVDRNHAIVVIAKMRDALQGYVTKMERLPLTPVHEDLPVETKGPFLATLLGQDPANNPENISFLEKPSILKPNERASQNAQGEWELRDPWGTFYKMQFDMDADGNIPNPAAGSGSGPRDVAVMPPGFIIYSAGPDGNFSTWADNVICWK